MRSISRGSNISNLSHDHVNQARETQDIAQKTIEHPTDVEDNKGQESSDEFEHYNAGSPDIKLKSIDIDETFTNNKKNKNKKIDDGISDDNSGTGHKAMPKKVNPVMQNSYGTEASS